MTYGNKSLKVKTNCICLQAIKSFKKSKFEDYLVIHCVVWEGLTAQTHRLPVVREIKIASLRLALLCRAVGTWGAPHPPDFLRSVNPISIRGLGADYDPRTFRPSYGPARVLFCVTKFSTLWNDGTFWPLSNAICRINGCEPIIRVFPYQLASKTKKNRLWEIHSFNIFCVTKFSTLLKGHF